MTGVELDKIQRIMLTLKYVHQSGLVIISSFSMLQPNHFLRKYQASWNLLKNVICAVWFTAYYAVFCVVVVVVVDVA